MAWTTPATAITGDVIPAAFWNTNGRDNLNFIYLKRVVELTNRSGASVAAGDVVILDTANDSSFTTTATADAVVVIGVADETIANAALGKVQVGGLATVATTGAISRGDRLATSTTAKLAKGKADGGAGDFALAVTGHAGPTGSVTALLFGGGASAIVLGGTPTTLQIGDAAGGGALATGARSDHRHGVTAPPLPTAVQVGDAALAGVGLNPARSDHTHAVIAPAAPTDVAIGDAAAAGSGLRPSRSDHIHGMTAPLAPTAITIGDAAAAGLSTRAARQDHLHGLTAPAGPSTQRPGDTAFVGVFTTVARADHRHAMAVDQAKVFRTTNQSIPNNTVTAISFDTEGWDTDTMHDTVTNPSRLTAQRQGVYLIVGMCQWATASGGITRDANIRLNGATNFCLSKLPPNANWGPTHHLTLELSLAAGEYIELVVTQDSGAALDILTVSADQPFFSMTLTRGF